MIPILGFISSEPKKNEIIEYLPILKDYTDKEVILIFIVVFLIIYLLKTLFVIFLILITQDMHKIYMSKLEINF